MLLLVAAQVGVARDAAARRRARRHARATFPQARLSGSPFAIGRQHGRRFRRQIRSNVHFYLRLLKQDGLGRSEALRLAKKFARPIGQHAPHILKEIDGIAAGSKSTRAEILLLNARTELLEIAARRAGKTKAPKSTETPGCTSLALVNRGRLAIGQNWDWLPQSRANAVVLRIARRGAPELVTFTEAGIVGKIGFNEHRVGVCLNYLSHADDRGPTRFGVPVHVLLRTAMESRSTAAASRKIARSPRSASANILLAQQTPRGVSAVDLETTPRRVARLRLRHGALVHANNFKHPALVAGCDRRADPTTLDRDRAAERVARTTRHYVSAVQRAQRLLRDRSTPTPISRTLADRKEPTEGVTVASIVISLGGAQPSFSITHGAPSEACYVRRTVKLGRRQPPDERTHAPAR